MAAIDLERGLEHGGRGWGPERPELMDNFDSEMQEWEDQLQDIQRKIEELYNEVQARRGGSDITQKTERELHPRNGSFLSSNSSKSPAANVPHHYNNGCNYAPHGYGYPMTHHNGYCHGNGVSQIGELLQDYLGQGEHLTRKNNGARHVHFSDTIDVSPDVPLYQDRKRSGHPSRAGQEQFFGVYEEAENRKNRGTHTRSSPNKENTGGKPPLGQKEAAAAQSRSTTQYSADSPALDRKCYGSGVLVDRKCSSPSVLRKFGAMLQENEGKTLTESGVVTQQGHASEPKCPTPSCQRRPTSATGRAPMSAQKADMLTAQMEVSQEWGSVSESARHNQKDLRGPYHGSKGPQPSPQAQRRSQMAGSPTVRPRADREGGARKPAPHHVEPKGDFRILNGPAQKSGCSRDDGLIELLDMLDIQHEYSHRNTAYKQEVNSVKSFSRPARPANQRPPSRWASRTPTARIVAPSGPMYRSPSPQAPSPVPKTRTPSPAIKRPLMYSPFNETVIM
ncbi:uncharacterized protein ACB058_019922 [Synchiropus picturatus]